MLAKYLASSLAYSKDSVHTNFYDKVSTTDETLCKTPETPRWGPAFRKLTVWRTDLVRHLHVWGFAMSNNITAQYWPFYNSVQRCILSKI